MMRSEDYKAAAKEMDRAVEEGFDPSTLPRVTAHVSKNRTDLVALRLRSDELVEIDNAAAARGQNLSEFMRDAALDRARSSQSLPVMSPGLAGAIDQVVKLYSEAQRQASRPRRSGRARERQA